MGRIILCVKLKILGIIYNALSWLTHHISGNMGVCSLLTFQSLDDFLCDSLKRHKNIAFNISSQLVDYVYDTCPEFIRNSDEGFLKFLRYSKNNITTNDILVRINPLPKDQILCIINNLKTKEQQQYRFSRKYLE